MPPDLPDPSDPDVLYTSDLHGSRTHYEEAFRLAASLGVRAVVLGGDLSPMGDPATQRAFHESFLVPFLREFLGRPGAPEVFAILGNVDWRANESLLLDARIPRFHYLHSRVAPFLDGALIAGLNCVPPTPIRLKDWERWEPEHWESSRLDGFRSGPDGSVYPFTFDGRENDESLEADFDLLEAAVRAARGASAAGSLVCVFHGPPFGTACDQITGGTHVGSRAARRFLSRVRPMLSLHGHIHESPAVSGRFADRVEGTVCVNPGQTPAALHAVTFRMGDPAASLRHTLLGQALLDSEAEPR